MLETYWEPGHRELTVSVHKGFGLNRREFGEKGILEMQALLPWPGVCAVPSPHSPIPDIILSETEERLAKFGTYLNFMISYMRNKCQSLEVSL